MYISALQITVKVTKYNLYNIKVKTNLTITLSLILINIWLKWMPIRIVLNKDIKNTSYLYFKIKLPQQKPYIPNYNLLIKWKKFKCEPKTLEYFLFALLLVNVVMIHNGGGGAFFLDKVDLFS